ncbi:MAG: type II toxin-antitoxin system VapC family toxin [Chloroflexi bacterium]|nr:type II toxin-antitoxin system VapC family toxin [Chloroflexota bacterium]
MATYIVDASVVVETLVEGPHSSNARLLFHKLLRGDVIVVPEFCLVECTNVLWKQVRFQNMPKPQAERLLSDLRALPLKRVPVKKLLPVALDIGLRHHLAVYDSIYIALALRSGYPLISLDHPQVAAAEAEGVVLKPLTDFRD